MALVDAYHELTNRLTVLLKPEEISDWWEMPNQQLGGLSAFTVLFEEGGPEQLKRVIQELEQKAQFD